MPFVFLDTLLSKLLGDLKKTRQAVYADATHKNHKTQWRAYLYFGFSFDLKPLPATLDTVCLYCQFLSRSMTPRSIRNYLSGVKLLHVFTGFELPFYDAPELKLTLRGLDRILKHAPSRAPHVTPELLREVIKCATYSPRDLVFSCAFLFAFFLFARISNLAPASVSSFNPSQQLCRGDIAVTRFGLSVLFKWSKTNQTGSKLLKVPLLYTSDPHLCPVRAYLRMCSRLPVTTSAPAFFTGSRAGSYIVITKSQFVSVFRNRLARMGVHDPSRFRGHSFRRGGATWAFHTGVPGELIQIFGDWVSDAYKCYLEFSDDAKLRVAREMVSSLPGVLYS